MSRSKARLVELGKQYGITNAEDIPYGQLERQIRDLKAQADPKPAKAKKPVKRAVKKPEPKKQASTTASRPKSTVTSGTSMEGTAAGVAAQAPGPDESMKTVKQPVGRVELRKGLVRYYYVVKANNGEITSVSQKYYSKYNAERAAFRVAKDQNLAYGDQS